MSNQWLAVDVATAPRQRAREIRRAWERFVEGGWDLGAQRDGVPVLRAPIEASWKRSVAAGVDPTGARVAPVVADADETCARWEVHPLCEAADVIRDCLAATADESGHLIVVSDANGVLLWMEGDPRVRRRAAESMNFAEGTLWSEGGAGTNAIGTALAAEHAVQVFASEHFSEVVQAWTCAAAPVRDPDTGQILGIIDLTGDMSGVHPHSMAVATATAQAVEGHLHCAMLDRDARLVRRYGEQLTAGPDPRALVAASGRVIAAHPAGWLPSARLALPPGGGQVIVSGGTIGVAEPLGCEEAYLVRGLPVRAPGDGSDRCIVGGARSRRAPRVVPTESLHLCLLGGDGHARLAGRLVPLRLRHAEILTLLCSRPAGLSSEELSVGLYGDPTRVGVVRVEISRLRKLLGDAVATDQYRLRPGVTSDVAEVCGLLHRGAVRDAAGRYVGSLLPRSCAPGVVHERQALEQWMRQSVMSAGDVQALWAWLQTDSGARDLAGWQRLLANVPFADPRRSLAAVKVSQLRAEA